MLTIAIEPTSTITRMNGQLCRLWRGVTDQGLAVEVFVCAVAVQNDADCLEFDRAILSMPAPDEAMTPLSRVAPARGDEDVGSN